MNSVWKGIVLKWLNCFGVDAIKSISDVKNRDFLHGLSLSSVSQSNKDPFEALLLYLHEHYPKYDTTLLDPNNVAWTEDENLFLVASLLLLHASIYHPSETFQQNAAQNFNGTEQNFIVQFLQGTMSYEQQLTRQKLIDSILASTGNTLTPRRHSLNLTSSPSLNLKAPLEEFLSSPVAQKRLSYGARDRIVRLEVGLKQEQVEEQELKEQVKTLQVQMTDLMKKHQEKVDEIKQLRLKCMQLERDIIQIQALSPAPAPESQPTARTAAAAAAASTSVQRYYCPVCERDYATQGNVNRHCRDTHSPRHREFLKKRSNSR